MPPRPRQAPLLSFPPPAPRHDLPDPAPYIQRRSRLVVALALVPLAFIFAVLAFAFYAYGSMICHQIQQENWRWILEAAAFLWLWGGCTGSIAQTYWRGGGDVPNDGKGDGDGGYRAQAEGFELGSDDDDDEAREEAALLRDERRSSVERSNADEADDGGGKLLPRSAVARSRPDGLDFATAMRELEGAAPVAQGTEKRAGAVGGGVQAKSNATTVLGPAEAASNYEMAPISWALIMLFGFIFGFVMSMFGGYHLYLACKNRTTIEAMETPTAYALPPPPPNRSYKPDYALTRLEARKLRKAADKFNIYDLGARRNLESIFGGWEKRWEWAMPWGWPPGDGTSFPIDEVKLEKLRKINMEVRLEGADGYGDSSDEYSTDDGGEDELSAAERRRRRVERMA
ncbi:hypothetical protein MNV49_005717 [Pseudohyphozyma bogoriensis]|nr:hypothetical protein MNV49_005717 [Pseudohyphozyma bogoriensis]